MAFQSKYIGKFHLFVLSISQKLILGLTRINEDDIVVFCSHYESPNLSHTRGLILRSHIGVFVLGEYLLLE